MKSELLRTLSVYKSRGLIFNQVHPTLPLTIWNYTPETQYGGHWDQITLMCRGLVTDDKGEIVAKGFPKFFNLEEGRHTPTDEFEVFEKLDGSLILVFWYAGQMIVASRGSFTSPYAIEAKRLLDEKYPCFEANAITKLTYCFELIGFEQIVVFYPNSDLVLTGIFNRHGTDWFTELAWESYVPIVKKYEGRDWQNIKGLNWQNKEGFVVKFSNGDRCKIKFEDYIKLHRQMTNLSTTSIWEALATGEPVSSILNDVPDEFYDKVHEYETMLKKKYNDLEEVHKDAFEILKFKDLDRKDFAETVNRTTTLIKGVLFGMLDGKDYSKHIWKMIKPKFQKL